MTAARLRFLALFLALAACRDERAAPTPTRFDAAPAVPDAQPRVQPVGTRRLELPGRTPIAPVLVGVGAEGRAVALAWTRDGRGVEDLAAVDLVAAGEISLRGAKKGERYLHPGERWYGRVYSARMFHGQQEIIGLDLAGVVAVEKASKLAESHWAPAADGRIWVAEIAGSRLSARTSGLAAVRAPDLPAGARLATLATADGALWFGAVSETATGISASYARAGGAWSEPIAVPLAGPPRRCATTAATWIAHGAPGRATLVALGPTGVAALGEHDVLGFTCGGDRAVFFGPEGVTRCTAAACEAPDPDAPLALDVGADGRLVEVRPGEVVGSVEVRVRDQEPPRRLARIEVPETEMVAVVDAGAQVIVVIRTAAGQVAIARVDVPALPQ